MLVPAYKTANAAKPECSMGVEQVGSGASGRGLASLVKINFSYIEELALRLHLSPCNNESAKSLHGFTQEG